MDRERGSDSSTGAGVSLTEIEYIEQVLRVTGSPRRCTSVWRFARTARGCVQREQVDVRVWSLGGGEPMMQAWMFSMAGLWDLKPCEGIRSLCTL